MSSNSAEDLTRDTFFHGRVTVYQPRVGYRFSLDSPMLADFLPNLPQGQALEIGTGCGIVSLLGLALNRFPGVKAVEIQPRLCSMARENARINGFGDRMSIQCGDFLQLKSQFSGIHLAFSNPPFRVLGRGRVSPNPEIRDARFETRITLGRMMRAVVEVLDKEGCFCLILPAEREGEMEKLAQEAGLFVERKRRVFSFVHGKPTRFLVQLSRHSRAVVREKPLVVFRQTGVYTPEMETILAGLDHDKKNS